MAKRPGKIQAFFNTESGSADSTRQGSLSEVIARQFGQPQSDEARPQAEPASAYPTFNVGNQQAFLLYQHTYKRSEQVSQQGNYLNEVDGQTGNGLEHLLPNAGTRFGVAYQRLEKEISSIKAKIRDYEQVFQSAPDSQKANLKESIHLLKSRLSTLERRFFKVSLGLSQVEQQNHPLRSNLKRPWLQIELWLKKELQQTAQQLGIPTQRLNPFKNTKKSPKNSAYQALQQAKTLLEAETQKAQPNPEIVSALVFRYEKSPHGIPGVHQSREQKLKSV